MKRNGLFKASICALLSVSLLAIPTACTTVKPATEPVTEIRYSGLPGISSLEKYSVKAQWGPDDIIYGGKFTCDIGGITEPCMAFSGGGVTFEKKEATEEERPDDFPANLKYYIITGVKWENFTIERNYNKDNRGWLEWWENTKEGKAEYKDITLNYLDKKGNPTGRSIKGINAFPVRYDVINLDARSGSSAMREVLEMVVEHYEYADGDNDDSDTTTKEAQLSELLTKGYFQAARGAEKAADITQVSKFNLDIVSGDEKTPTGSWWGITGGDQNIEVITYTTGTDPDEKKEPGQAYFGDITVSGPFCKDRKSVMDWVNDIAKGKRDRKDLTLDFLDKKDQLVMTFDLADCLPVSYSPPAVSTDNYSLLEERFTFLVIQIEQK